MYSMKPSPPLNPISVMALAPFSKLSRVMEELLSSVVTSPRPGASAT